MVASALIQASEKKKNFVENHMCTQSCASLPAESGPCTRNKVIQVTIPGSIGGVLSAGTRTRRPRYTEGKTSTHRRRASALPPVW
jgi:hypothetical protein